MMTTCSSTIPTPDGDATRCPDTVVDRDESDARRVAPDVEDVEVEEAGYGYGV